MVNIRTQNCIRENIKKNHFNFLILLQAVHLTEYR